MYVSGSAGFPFGTIRTNVRNFFLIFLCNCKIKFYICITKTSLSYGVMVTQQILVLLFLVRIQVAQHRKPAVSRLRVFRFLPLMPPLPHPCAGAPDRRSSPARKSRRIPCAKEPSGPARVPRTGTHKSKDRLPSPFTRSDRTSGRPVRRTAPRRLFRSTNPCRLKQDGVQAKKNRKTGGNDPFRCLK